MRILIPKNDIVRHNILAALNTKTNGQEYKNNPDWWMTVPEMLSIAKVSDKEYRVANALLWEKIEIYTDILNDEECVRIASNGITALNERKYLKEGRSFVINRIKDYASITTLFITITTTIVSLGFAANSLTTNRSKIKALQEQVNKLSKQVKPLTDTSSKR